MGKRGWAGLATGHVEPRIIAPHWSCLPQVLQSFVQDCRCRTALRQDQAVVHPAPLAARRDDAGAPQIGEVARDFRLADPQDFDEIADANFSVGNEVQKTQPCWIGKGAKQEIERKGLRLGGHTAEDYIWLDRYEQDA
jgi:hypothetical protein